MVGCIGGFPRHVDDSRSGMFHSTCVASPKSTKTLVPSMPGGSPQGMSDGAGRGLEGAWGSADDMYWMSVCRFQISLKSCRGRPLGARLLGNPCWPGTRAVQSAKNLRI